MAFASSEMRLLCRSGIQQPCQSVSASLKSLNPSSTTLAPGLISPANFGRLSKIASRRREAVTCFARPLRPVEERFRIQVERNVDEQRMKEFNIERWPKWESECCAFDHEWKVDEQVYVVKGSVRVTPEDCEDHAYFYAGDLVRYPKWFNATLSFDEEYEQRYRFLAYGDD